MIVRRLKSPKMMGLAAKRLMHLFIATGVVFNCSAQCDLSRIVAGPGNDVRPSVGDGVNIGITVRGTDRDVLEYQKDLIATCACEYDLRGYLIESSDYWYRFIGASSVDDALNKAGPHLNTWVTNTCAQLRIEREHVHHYEHDGSISMQFRARLSRSDLAQILASEMEGSFGVGDSRYGSLVEGLIGVFKTFYVDYPL